MKNLLADSETAAINMIEKIVSDENIDCDFKRVNGYMFLEPGKVNELQEELEAVRKEVSTL